MGALRPLAIANDYAGMHAAFRQYVEEINLSRSAIDHATGWADGLAGKALAPEPAKGMNKTTLGPFLQATGLVLIIAQDIDEFNRRRARLLPRQASQARPGNQSRRNAGKVRPKPARKRKRRRSRGKYE